MLLGPQRAIVESSVAWMGTFFDPAANLLRYPSDTRRHTVRESLWYAAGLLQLGRVDVARLVFDAVIDLQFDRPGAAWDGTWPRAPEETQPRDGAVIWRDYDPNWRQFIGCLLGVLLRDCGKTLGPERCERASVAIARAIRGEPAERIGASYSNIALMQAWLLCEFGDRARGERLGAEIERLYLADGGFSEFNSPTYYGVDLWGLALWQRSDSPLLIAAGRRLEAALWRDVAMFYHPGMRNLCGPYDRAYGMDMTRYASLLGLWMWWANGDDGGPFPDVSRPFGHAHDFCAAPLLAFARPTISDEARGDLSAAPDERRILRRVSDRTISAALHRDLMLGAVDRAPHDPTGQSTPVTAHWIEADNTIGWLCIRGALGARVTDSRLELHSESELILHCSDAPKFGRREWVIGGRRIEAAGVDVVERRDQNGRPMYAVKLTSGEAVLVFA